MGRPTVKKSDTAGRENVKGGGKGERGEKRCWAAQLGQGSGREQIRYDSVRSPQESQFAATMKNQTAF